MKTIKELLKELPEPYRSKALANYEEPKANTISSALSMAFDWVETPEGFEYWNDAFNKFLNV